MSSKNTLLLVFNLLFFSNLFAQVKPMDELSKDDILENQNENDVEVVSASRSSKKLKDLPMTIEVITKEEIRKNGYITLADVLKHVQGMKVSQPGNATEGEMFLMRGLVGNFYTKILLNSIPLQPSAIGALPIAEQLPIAQAERIEIIFGPASSIYGADAMAGVINIITQNDSEYNYVQGNLVSDNAGLRHFNFMAGGKFGKDKNVVKYSIYANFADRPDLNISEDSALYSPLNYVDFFPLQDFAVQNPEIFLNDVITEIFPFYSGTTFKPIIGDKPQNSYLFGVQLNYRNWTFSFNEMYRQTHAAIGLSPVVFSHDNPNSYNGDNIRRFTLTYQKDWKRFSLTTNLSYNRYRINHDSFRATNYQGFGGISYKYAASDDIFGEILLRYTSKKGLEWTTGLSAQLSGILPVTNDLEQPFNESDYRAFSEKPLPPHELFGDFGLNPLLHSNVGGFLQLLKSTRKWTYILGLRIDNNTAYENVSNVDDLPTGQIRASAQYRAKENLSFRFSIGTAVKAPSPSDTHISLALPDSEFPQDSITYQQVPNVNLQPEILSSVELGMRYQMSNKLSLEVILHSQNIDNRIIRLFTAVDREIYPRAAQDNSGLASFPTARTFLNDENTNATLSSLQLILKGKDLIPQWKFNMDLSLTLSAGDEILSSEEQNNIIELNSYRTMPSFIGQLNLDFKPHKNWYIRLENVLMDSWTNRFFLPNEVLPDFNNTTKGYYTLDILARYNLSKNLSSYLKVINVFNADYGGIGATGFDVDLPYNPQYLRTFQFGINFNL